MSKRKKLPSKPVSTFNQAIEMDMTMVTVPKGLIDALHASWQANIEFDLAVGKLDEDDPELAIYANKRSDTCMVAGIAMEVWNNVMKKITQGEPQTVKA